MSGTTDSTSGAAPTVGAAPVRLRGRRTATVASGWLRGNQLGLLVMALLAGLVAGFGAVGFRYLIFLFTWVATGRFLPLAGVHASDHLPELGRWFYWLIPVLGGIIYGPVIYKFAREARGHGVPEVMIAVAENGGRIRPQVAFVKAFASALCIGTGGSVGREGPIVQIGSSLASTLGQLVRMPESRLRILVACGAAGGISATFNAPITGVFFAFELILREFSIAALFPIFVSSMVADVVSRQFFGSRPFFSTIPHPFPQTLSVHHIYTYLLIAVLGLVAGLIGVAFKTLLYKVEDTCDAVWAKRPEWARPAVGGIVFGLLIFALPQLYGVGYPVMGEVVGDPSHYLLLFVIVLAIGKMVAVSLTMGIGGSGGVFAPSLFTGAMAGTAFGMIVHAIFGAATGPPALYGMVAMGAVFASSAQAPLTSLASVVEMTGDFALTLPVMLAVGISAAVSKHLTYGTIYTTKLLRRGTDIERPKPSSALLQMTVRDAMQTFDGALLLHALANGEAPAAGVDASVWPALAGPVLRSRVPQALFGEETLAQALRQLVLYGRDGLPVVSADTSELIGWITNRDVLAAVAERLRAATAEIEQGELSANFGAPDAQARLHTPSTPLTGYQIVEITITDGTIATGRRVGDVAWPNGRLVVATTHHGRTRAVRDDTELHAGDGITVLVPAGGEPGDQAAPKPAPPSAANNQEGAQQP
ncbi:MAG: chloride channel protein [Streptosporangiaceae bacterium]